MVGISTTTVNIPKRLNQAVPARQSEVAVADATTQVPTDKIDINPSAPELVNVAHKRELRGAWVASVYNINFPSSQTASVTRQKQELTDMLDRLQDCGFNSIFFQVRPEGDALYKSELEPWAGALTGKQGKDPGYDPLAFLIDEAHQRNIEVHAWLNPYRAGAATKEQVAPHIAATNPEVVHPYDRYEWMDPGSEVVRDRLVDVCADITKRYDVDGIHFDDYFYPYPVAGKAFPDDATFGAYQAGGGKMSRPDWRRDNVNKAVREVSDAVRGEKDHVRFGISPFGIPAPNKPAGISGLDQYEELYADTQKWMDEGSVDYLAPQLYWRTDQTRQAYGTLLNWWADHAKEGRHIFAGNSLASLGSAPKWNVDEFRKEVELSRAKHDQGSQGNIWWHIAPLMENRSNIANVFKNEFYAEPALTPALARAEGKTVQPPQVQVQGDTVKMRHQDAAPLRAWTVYKPDGDKWKLDRIVSGDESEFKLEAGRWAVAATSMHGVESKGVVVQVG